MRVFGRFSLFTMMALCCGLSTAAEAVSWKTGPGTSEVENGAVLEHDLLYRDGNGQAAVGRFPQAAVILWNSISGDKIGRYRIALRARTKNLDNSNLTLMAWVNQNWEADVPYVPIAQTPLSGCIFAATNQWQDFSLEFDVEAGKPATAGLMYVGGEDPRASAKRRKEKESLTSLKKDLPKIEDISLDVGGEAGKPGTAELLNVEEKAPSPAGRIQIERASLKLERLDLPLSIAWARSAKIRYKHAEPGALEIRLTNAGDQPCTVAVRPIVISDADVRTPGTAQPFTIPAKSTTAGTVSFAVPASDGGYEALSELLQGDKVIDRRSGDVFAVSDNPFQSAIQMNGGLTFSGPGAGHLGLKGFKAEVMDKWDWYVEKSTADVEAMRRNYVTCFEYFAWAHEDATWLTEDSDEPYLSGQTCYPTSCKQLLLHINLFKRHGIAPVAYVNAAPFGWPAFELLRRRPEWFYGSASSVDTAALEKYVNGEPLGGYIYPCIGVDYEKKSPIDGKTFLDYHLEQLTASAKLHGWEAFRYDAGALPDQYFPLVKQRLAALNPSVSIGNNMGVAFMGVEPSARWATYCNNGSLMMEENIDFAFRNANDPHRRWKDWIDYLRLGSHLTRSHGGHYDWINHSGNWYSAALGYAVGGHPWTFIKSPFGDSERFMVRYGYYFWDLRTQMFPRPETVISVTSPRPLWWKQLVSQRTLEKGHRQIIVPLINPPAGEEVAGVTAVGPAEGVTVAFTPRSGESVTAWLLTPEPVARREQLVTRTLSGGRVEVTAPRFWMWSNVVFDCRAQ